MSGRASRERTARPAVTHRRGSNPQIIVSPGESMARSKNEVVPDTIWVNLSRDCLYSHFRKDQRYSYCKDKHCECWCHGRLNSDAEAGRKRTASSRYDSTIRPGSPTRILVLSLGVFHRSERSDSLGT